MKIFRHRGGCNLSRAGIRPASRSMAQRPVSDPRECPSAEDHITAPIEPCATQLGSCYGFGIRSSLPFEFLRPGTGVPLTISESEQLSEPRHAPLQIWPEIPGKRMHVRLYGGADSYVLTIGRDHVFAIELHEIVRRGGRITVSPGASARTRERLLWTTPAAVAIAARGDVALHAAAVEVDGQAILLTGPGGAGKTTTAAAFYRAGFRVLADDLACCHVSPAGLSPGPALLRVNSDAADRVLGIRPDEAFPPDSKVPFSFPAHRRGDGTPVPLGGLVMLRAGDGPIHIQRVPSLGALQPLWSAIFHLPGDAHRARAFQLLAAMLGNIPVWDVSRRLDWAALPDLVDRIALTCRP